jgi:hypothetical protein
MEKLLSHIRILPDKKRILTRLVFAGVLLLLVGAGIFSPTQASAAQRILGPGEEGCYTARGTFVPEFPDEDSCIGANTSINTGTIYLWKIAGDSVTVPDVAPTGTANPNAPSAFEAEVYEYACGIGSIDSAGGSFFGCVLETFYLIFYTVPALLLFVAAYVFNVLIEFTLQDELFRSTFIVSAWEVVRDLSNIFFILVLLYIAVRTILGIGSSDVKKMIARVVIMALLINFSLFFTRVIVDTSNILALVFYNRIEVQRVNPDGTVSTINYDNVRGEKDVAGAMTHAFNPTRLLTPEFFQATKDVSPPGVPPDPDGRVPVRILLGILVITGLIMGFAAYTFLISGVLFLARLLELWMLMIFSPFAFMSSTVPKLEKIKHIGWEEWTHKLLKTAFVAPIFMFMLYFIFLLVQKNPFSDVTVQNNGMVETILLVVIPAFVILYLLRYAVKFAKEGSGEIGAGILKAGKIAGGVALGGVGLAAGAAVGGAALVGTKTLGAASSAVASSRLASGKGALSRGLRRTAQYGSQASFDLRKTGIGTLTKKVGIDLDASKAIGLGVKEGGYEKARTDKVKRRQERAQQLEVGEDETLKQEQNKVEADLQDLLKEVSSELELVDKKITSAREDASDAARRFGSGSAEARTAGQVVDYLKDYKTGIKTGSASVFNPTTGVNENKSHLKRDGNSIKNLESAIIPEAKAKVLRETRERKQAYADATTKFSTIKIPWVGNFNNPLVNRANREAAHKIKMENKLDSGEKH